MSWTYTTVQNVSELWRQMSNDEQDRAEKLIDVVENSLRQEAYNRGKDLDEMVSNGDIITEVLVSVVVDIVSRTLMTSTNQEPMTQYSQSALGYVQSGSFLNPGGGIFIKNSELAKLGIKKQRCGVIDLC